MSVTTSEFSPTEHGFVHLCDFDRGEGLEFYELRNHECVDGVVDFCRLNYYLSQDEDYVTVWQGCLEFVLMEARLGELALGDDNFHDQLFCGYIESVEQAGHILRALRALRMESGPSLMVKGAGGRMECCSL